MRYHLVKLSSEIYEDSYEQGELGFTGCGYSGECIGKTFDTVEACCAYLSVFGLPEDADGYDIDNATGVMSTTRMVADHSDAQNGGWFEPTQAEKDLWIQGKQKLYAEHFLVTFVRCL